MPSLLPTVMALGYDPLWFGIIITRIAVSLGMERTRESD